MHDMKGRHDKIEFLKYSSRTTHLSFNTQHKDRPIHNFGLFTWLDTI